MAELISAKLFFKAASSGFLGACLWAEPVMLVVDAMASVMMKGKKRQEEKNNKLLDGCCNHNTASELFEKLRGHVIGSLPIDVSPRPRASTVSLSASEDIRYQANQLKSHDGRSRRTTKIIHNSDAMLVAATVSD
jgi:hypothetical protein